MNLRGPRGRKELGQLWVLAVHDPALEENSGQCRPGTDLLGQFPGLRQRSSLAAVEEQPQVADQQVAQDPGELLLGQAPLPDQPPRIKAKLDSQIRAKKQEINWLKGYVMGSVEIGEKFNDATTNIYIRESDVLVPATDMEICPEKYPEWSTAKWSLNKAAIKKAIKAGEEVAGCEIKKSRSIQIR